MKSLFWFGALGAIGATLLVSACSTGPKVDGKLGPGVSMSGFSSYTIVAAPTGVGERTEAGIDFIENRVAPEVDRAMTAKGYAAAPRASADLLVAVFVSQTGQVDAVRWGYTTVGWEIWGPWWGTGVYGYSQDYRTGTVVVDVVSAKSRSVLYRGVVSAVVGLHGEPDQKQIRRRVQEMLRDLPSRS
ncbi:MAG: DUF4136 domain-containing protein [Thermoanaerobaculia bacterium]